MIVIVTSIVCVTILLFTWQSIYHQELDGKPVLSAASVRN